MIEIAGFVPLHPNPLHDPARGPVVGRCVGSDLRETKSGKPVGQRRRRSFGRKPLATVLFGQPPGDFHGRSERRVKRHHTQTNAPYEFSAPSQFDHPRTVAMPIKVVSLACNPCLSFCLFGKRQQMCTEVRRRGHLNERAYVGVPPFPEYQTGSAEFGRHRLIDLLVPGSCRNSGRTPVETFRDRSKTAGSSMSAPPGFVPEPIVLETAPGGWQRIGSWSSRHRTWPVRRTSRF